MSAMESEQARALVAGGAGSSAAGTVTTVRDGRSGTRLAWLDALRGFAALCVVFDHTSYLVLQPVRSFLYHWLDMGQYGVFVFFLISGYIIPASLERKGSVRAFWISRAFRLYPMYAVAIVLAVIGFLNGIGNIAGAQHQPVTAIASWLLMLQNLLSGPNIPNVVWTLFYLLLAALFTWRIHRQSGGYALAFAAAAVALGGVLPMWSLYRAAHGPSGIRILDLTADALILIGIGLTVSGRGSLSRIGAAIAALTGLVLVTVNQSYPYPWSGLVILALMFTGTLVYRAEQGQVSKSTAVWIAGTVLLLTITAGVWHGARPLLHGTSDLQQWRYQWVSSLVLAAITFAFGLAVRHRKIPVTLAWLGLVSYPVYLLHLLVLSAYQSLVPQHRQPVAMQILLAAGILAVVLAVSAVAHYGVEIPMQRLGRRAAKKWR
jgi:peptidoglycan/LPS O-acetylase OafA/YrhL